MPELTPRELREKLDTVQVLLIDVRSHAEFERDSIPARRITCFEPATLRFNMSVNDLEDTLVISPPIEADSFGLRDVVDMIVLYDQRSTSVAESPSLVMVDSALRNAGFQPYLLKGGLSAWHELERGQRQYSVDGMNGINGVNLMGSSPTSTVRRSLIEPLKPGVPKPPVAKTTREAQGQPTQSRPASSISMASPTRPMKPLHPAPRAPEVRPLSRRWTMPQPEDPQAQVVNTPALVSEANPTSSPSAPAPAPNPSHAGLHSRVRSNSAAQRLSFPEPGAPMTNYSFEFAPGPNLSLQAPFRTLREVQPLSFPEPEPAVPVVSDQAPPLALGQSPPKMPAGPRTLASRAPTYAPMHTRPRSLSPERSPLAPAQLPRPTRSPPPQMYNAPMPVISAPQPLQTFSARANPVAAPHVFPTSLRADHAAAAAGGYADMPAKSSGLKIGKLLPRRQANNATIVSAPVPVQFPQAGFQHPAAPPRALAPHEVAPDERETDRRLVAPLPESINPALLKSTGLRNLGNTCYMNCVIQCMLSVPQLIAPFADGRYVQFINYKSRLGYKGEFANEFAALVHAMLRPETKYMAPLGMKRLSGQLRPDSFAGYEQQDCQEFLTFLLDCLHEDLNVNGHQPKDRELAPEEEERREQLSIRVASAIEWERYLKGDTSLIVDLFQGQYLSQLKCLSCQRTSTTYNSFSSLSLPIVGNRMLGGHATLKGCFDEFVKPEVLDGENAWLCPHCKQKRKASKTLRISRLPPVLIIHLKRFKRSKNFGMNKLETPVDYPLRHLDLTKYWPQLKQHEFNQKESELLAHLPDRGQHPPFVYDLRAVTMHQGSLKGGHYTAIAEKPGLGWFLYDDAVVTPVKEQAAVSKNAYVLVYQRRM